MNRRQAVFFRPLHGFAYERAVWEGFCPAGSFAPVRQPARPAHPSWREESGKTTSKGANMQKNTTGAGRANPTIPPFNYPNTRSGLAYAVPVDAAPFDLADHLESRLLHLDSMLHMTHGGGGESFRSFSEEIQDSYLWACSETAAECLELVRQLMARMGRQ
jgi:hypothetical protein